MAFDISNPELQHKQQRLPFDHHVEADTDLSDILQYLTSAKLCCANFRTRQSPVVKLKLLSSQMVGNH